MYRYEVLYNRAYWQTEKGGGHGLQDIDCYPKVIARIMKKKHIIMGKKEGFPCIFQSVSHLRMYLHGASVELAFL